MEWIRLGQRYRILLMRARERSLVVVVHYFLVLIVHMFRDWVQSIWLHCFAAEMFDIHLALLFVVWLLNSVIRNLTPETYYGKHTQP